ncbi:MAG: hypothetical protein KGZ34_04295 [Nitrosarchaeum sp.]|nr:hypothetical protein [Nitrosarchaeum sp.]
MELTERSLWLLALIESSPYVNGNTRLQKYALLSTKIVLENEEKYEDWEPNDFGGFSRQVGLEIQYFTKNELIEQDTVNSSGQEHHRYSITKKGRELIKEFINSKRETYDKLKTITNFYFKRPLNDLLTDTYTLYPEYTSNSKIKHIVRQTLLKRTLHPNLQYVVPFTTKQPDLSIISSTEHVNAFQFQDERIREKLSAMIGLKSIPKIESNSVKKLSGILENRITENEVDAIEIVSSVRGHI